MRIALAQINPTVADIQGNAKLIEAFAAKAEERGADLVVFPEMSLLGYPPRDLVEKSSLVEANLSALKALAVELRVPALVGFVAKNETGEGLRIHNSVALLRDGAVETVRHKRLLPTYDVFDEDRYFEPGRASDPIPFGDFALGVSICEDAWRPIEPQYSCDPIAQQVAAGAQALINLSASPFTLGKRQTRMELFGKHASDHGLPLFMCNQVGGNDELIFDGGSMVFDAKGRLVAEAPLFEEHLLIADLEALGETIETHRLGDEEMAYRALVLGIRDYLRKCGFEKAIVGLSGGIDSSLTAVLATEALGPRNVLGVSMPSRYSSQHSRDDAKTLADNLGIEYLVVPIEPAHSAFLDMLVPAFKDMPPDVTEENLQARIRGNILMALSNKFGSLVLTTGNKSELAVGYATLYGDMCGGLAPINDVPKTMAYDIATWVNRDREIIPQSCITKAPSAELRPNQTDQDSLPPYEILDAILHAYVEAAKDFHEIVAEGHDPETVARVLRMIDRAEYKRRQAAPGLKVTSKAFGYGRRVPVAKKIPQYE